MTDTINPYSAPETAVPDAPPQVPLQYRPARRFARLAARIVDMVPVAFMGGAVAAAVPPSGSALRTFSIVFILALLAGLVLQLWLLHRRGQTIGKILVKIRIVRTSGERAGLGRIVLLRYLPFEAAAFIPLVGGLIAIIDAAMIFGERRRCLHDLVAGTKVIDISLGPAEMQEIASAWEGLHS